MSNTSFEHVLHNIHERDCLVDTMKPAIKKVLDNLVTQNTDCASMSNNLRLVSCRIDTVYNEYKQTISRFNIGIISFISEYYSIVDQHSDQFDPKFMHAYSDHKGHYSPILSGSLSEKFKLDELISIFVEHCYELKKFKFYTESSYLRRARERTWSIYQQLSNYIASEAVYDKSDLLIHEIESIVCYVSTSVAAESDTSPRKTKIKKLKVCDESVRLLNKIRNIIQQYNNIKLDFKSTEEILDFCECGAAMHIISGSSEMVCNTCGFSYELKGTVFSDDQFYAQEGIRWKAAGYEPSKHCKAWLERIQARETNSISDQQIRKIEACIKRDGITNKKRLSIEQLRRYLKDTGLTELNEHVALIKRLITGVTPPQLTFAETQDITNSFSKAVKAYNIIRPSNKSNLLFYPFILYKLIDIHVSEYYKRKSLLSFIHLQGTQTLIQNDQIWGTICKIVHELKYRPTDRYEYCE